MTISKQTKKKIYIYFFFPFYSARYVGVERDICCDRGKNRETILSSLQACFVIAHSSGDFIVKNILTSLIYFTNLHNRRVG